MYTHHHSEQLISEAGPGIVILVNSPVEAKMKSTRTENYWKGPSCKQGTTLLRSAGYFTFLREVLGGMTWARCPQTWVLVLTQRWTSRKITWSLWSQFGVWGCDEPEDSDSHFHINTDDSDVRVSL